MSIKKVRTIPQPKNVRKAEPFEITEKINKDLHKAWEGRYEKFEFTGYDNPSYVSSYARKLADKMIIDDIVKPGYDAANAKLQKKFKKTLGEAAKYIAIPNQCYSAEPCIIIRGVTVNGVKRVFGEIDWDYILHISSRLAEKWTPYFTREDIQAKLIAKLENEQRRATGDLTIREYSEMIRKQRGDK